MAGVRWISLSLLLHRYDWPNEIYGELSLSFSYITHTQASAHNPLWNCPQTHSLGWMVAQADVPDNRASLTIPHPSPPFLMLCSSLDIQSPVMAKRISFASSAWSKTFLTKVFCYHITSLVILQNNMYLIHYITKNIFLWWPRHNNKCMQKIVGLSSVSFEQCQLISSRRIIINLIKI